MPQVPRAPLEPSLGLGSHRSAFIELPYRTFLINDIRHLWSFASGFFNLAFKLQAVASIWSVCVFIAGSILVYG